MMKNFKQQYVKCGGKAGKDDLMNDKNMMIDEFIRESKSIISQYFKSKIKSNITILLVLQGNNITRRYNL